MFADDLMNFSSGRDSFVRAVKEAVDNFLSRSGLSMNFQKSQLIIVCMSVEKKLWAEGIIGCSLRPLPVMYLGLPLSSIYLRASDCDELTMKTTARRVLECSQELPD